MDNILKYCIPEISLEGGRGKIINNLFKKWRILMNIKIIIIIII